MQPEIEDRQPWNSDQYFSSLDRHCMSRLGRLRPEEINVDHQGTKVSLERRIEWRYVNKTCEEGNSVLESG